MREDFPGSGENVRKADKRGAGPAGLSAKLTEGEKNCRSVLIFLQKRYPSVFSPSEQPNGCPPPSSEGGMSLVHRLTLQIPNLSPRNDTGHGSCVSIHEPGGAKLEAGPAGQIPVC